MYDGMTSDGSRRVLIADPQPIFRLGLVALLESAYPNWDILEVGTLAEHRAKLQDGSIDLLIVDSGLLGLEVAQGLPVGGGMNMWVDIIAVTESGDTLGALGCLGAGAHATISRSDPTGRILTTIEVLAAPRRGKAVTRGAVNAAAEAPAEIPDTSQLLNLTARQFDVLRLLAKGQSNKVIARDLGLSVSTVKVHLNIVFRALGARNRLEAVVRARPFQDRMAPQEN
jgi:two-component system nitrate/nitrite response regulator NarL